MGIAVAADSTVAGSFFEEPPTLISLGFEWQIEGDDNRNAEVNVWYRPKGTETWVQGLPLFRLQRERINRGPLQFTTPNMFAGSIFDLEPDTEYDARFVLTDPDGVSGEAERVTTIRTRDEPRPFAGGSVYHVYPPGHTGSKVEPAFTGLLEAYYTGSAHSDNSNTFPPRVHPGDTILVHAGLYKDNRFRYGRGEGLGTISDGTYFLTQTGTADKPIVIKAAGDGEVIFDGDGAHNLFNVMAANYNYFEGLTIRNTEIAFLAGRKNIAGSAGLTIKNSRFESIGRGVMTDWSGSKNFYIADNVFIGLQDPERLIGTTGRTWERFPEFPPKLASEFAVKVYGSGHVVAYNYIANFHDGVDHATYGNPDGTPDPIRDRLPVANDFYNNDVTNVDDNCIEADGAAYNIRILRNRCFNHGHRALSAQPTFGGPVYYIRNLVYHAPEGGAFKTSSTPAGMVVYHNTLFAPVRWMISGVSNIHFRNNLIIGRSEVPELFAIDTFTNYSSSDYNGFRPNDDAEYSFQWISPPAEVAADYEGLRVTRNFATFNEYRAGTGQDTHSVLIDYDTFVNARPPDRVDPRRLYEPGDYDFRLNANSNAVDAGMRLFNVNDDLTGSAPDLGAYENGRPIPHYGPRVVSAPVRSSPPVLTQGGEPCDTIANDIERLACFDRVGAVAPAVSAVGQATIGSVVVVEIRTLTRGVAFTTDRGEVWSQIENERVSLPAVPFSAEIKPAAMGSYFLVPKDRARGYRVRPGS